MVSRKTKKRNRKPKRRVVKRRNGLSRRKLRKSLRRKVRKTFASKRKLRRTSTKKAAARGSKLVTVNTPLNLTIKGFGQGGYGGNTYMYCSSEDCTEFQAYADMYDEYRIVDMTVIFSPSYTVANFDAVADLSQLIHHKGERAGLRMFAAALDHQQVPADPPYNNGYNSTWEICRHDPLYVFSTLDTSPTSVSVKPCINSSVISSGNDSVAAGIVVSPWLRTAIQHVEHYGLMIVPDGSADSIMRLYSETTVAGCFNILKRTTFEFRGLH